VVAVILTVCVVYVSFGFFCVQAWGTDMKTPLITDMLPNGWVTYTILILFSLNLVFSYPLVLYPAHIILENIFYAGWPKSKKRQMCKNNSRTILVFLTCVVTIMLGDKLDKFLSILGALTCTPIAFTFPALFHLKAVASTTAEKVSDIILIIFSLAVLIYCTVQGILNWSLEDEKPVIDYSKVPH
jgi:solute carrier family 36 (proton-coupled amino acid transporter)